jgi:hypothetical protein
VRSLSVGVSFLQFNAAFVAARISDDEQHADCFPSGPFIGPLSDDCLRGHAVVTRHRILALYARYDVNSSTVNPEPPTAVAAAAHSPVDQ